MGQQYGLTSGVDEGRLFQQVRAHLPLILIGSGAAIAALGFALLLIGIAGALGIVMGGGYGAPGTTLAETEMALGFLGICFGVVMLLVGLVAWIVGALRRRHA